MASLSRILSRQIHVSARRHALSKFSMPAMSPTMTEGGISNWNKKEGDTFAAGDVILEIETDKATMDVEAQDDGVMAKIMIPEGTKGIKVGTPIAIIAEEGDDLSAAAEFAEKAQAESSSGSSSPPKEESKPEPPKSEDKPKPTESSPPPKSAPAKDELQSGDVIFATPIAKKIALERGIPLGKVKGTGPEGRIIRADVESYKTAASPTSTTTIGASSESVAAYTDTPLTNMRKVIGTRLLESKTQIPHYYVTVDVDMERVIKLREVFNKSLQAKEDSKAKLSVNDFIVKASALALRDVPEANSAWLGEQIRQHHKADICVAVATPTGLITPIVKDVGSKGLTEISSETKALAKKARDGKLAPHEYQGGSFTISNMGMMGVSHFTAIINPPQSAILALGSVVPTLVPADNEKGFATKQIMKATLSADHRIVDGAVAARFLGALRSYLENPLSFML